MQSVELILFVSVALVLAGVIASRTASPFTGERLSTVMKIVIGVLIGLIGAVIVAALSADFVPDDWEQIGRPIMVAIITVALIAAFARRWVPR